MSSTPLVSVVMPVRDGARFLDEAVASVVNQSLGELELIVVDDGSEDATAAILAAWSARDARIRVVTRAASGGVAVALRDGISQARSDLLARLDADDRAAPNRLRRQVETFHARPELGLLGTAARHIDEHGRAVRIEVPPTGSEVATALRHANVFFHPSVMVRRSAYNAAGGYRAQIGPAEDYDLWLRIAESYEIDNLAEPLIDYRLHPEQSMFVQMLEQATAAAAARWAASVRASGAPDPVDTLDHVDETVLLANGVPIHDLRVHRRDACLWAAESYESAGYPRIASACWRAARIEASGLGRMEEGQVLLQRASLRRLHGRRLSGLADRFHAAVLAPELLGQWRR